LDSDAIRIAVNFDLALNALATIYYFSVSKGTNEVFGAGSDTA
jgi:hypothetical protein